MKKHFFIILVLPALLISCQKDTENLKLDDFWSQIELKVDSDKKGSEACFEIQFPLSVVMPDRSVVTGNDKNELGKAIKAWYKEHGKEGKDRKKITLKYPITVDFQGRVLTLENERQLERIKMACKGDKEGDGLRDRDRDRDRDGDRDKTPCIELIYPVTYEMPDGTRITGESGKDLRAKMGRWFEAHPDARKRGALVYPVEVKFKGRQITIESERAMLRVREACKGEAEKEKEPCFKMVYPLTYVMPDRTTVTVESEEAAKRVFERWYNAHPDSKQRPSLKFPIEINYGGERGDRIVEISDAEALKKAYEDCDR